MAAEQYDDLFSFEELYLAYRKAKADHFYERTIPNSLKFARFEANLDENIRELRERLLDNDRPWYQDIEFIGAATFVPKKLTPPKEPVSGPVFFASNARDSWARVFELDEAAKTAKGKQKPQRLNAEFRQMADFTVQMHVVCALWINLVGEKIDAALEPSALGARLRRIAGSRKYHKQIWQSFEPYFKSYRKWRDGGFAAIRRELEAGRRVVAITMDFQKFFHRIDPSFLFDDEFKRELTIAREEPVDFSGLDEAFTRQLVEAFECWARQVPGYTQTRPTGLPVGSGASRVIANAFLIQFDRLIREKLSPIYYARYVDDVFLVLPDNRSFATGADVLVWIEKHAKELISSKRGDLSVKLSYGRKSKVDFQKEKQRIFLIDNPDILDAIKSKVDEVSSEWRLLPNLRDLEKSSSARVLSTSRDGSSDGDSLRKTDTLLLKRLGFAILLRNIDAISDAIPPDEWRTEREEFYEFALRHVIAPGKLFELIDYLPRLISICSYCSDWEYATTIVSTVVDILTEVRNRGTTSIQGGKEIEESAVIWDGFMKHLRSAFEEAFLKAYSVDQVGGSPARALRAYDEICKISPTAFDSYSHIIPCSELLFWHDLGRDPLKSVLLREIERTYAPDFKYPECDFPESLKERCSAVSTMLDKFEIKDRFAFPLLFPTRPLGNEDLSILFPEITANVSMIKESLNIIRGTHYKTGGEGGVSGYAAKKDVSDASFRNDEIERLRIGFGSGKKRIRIAVTSFLTEMQSWHAAAGGNPDHRASRFSRVARLCNAILTSPREARPDYVLFPELSIPSRWMRTIAESLLRSGISVIAGEEYVAHSDIPKMVDSPARLFLTDNRLGFPSWVRLTQLKGKPAHHERDELRQVHGVSLGVSRDGLERKRVFEHFGFSFGLLICSELTDMEHRIRFRGEIDSLFVLSWNQDLESFSALVDASALDIHCFVALVNNRMFGDSRVRIPAKDAWRRDAVRVKGGLADYFVVAEIDVSALRDFQNHLEPPSDPFKPFPEGFSLADERKVIPGTNGVRPRSQ
ncbi:RNA-directed DNA polymerase [Rubinisphaera margarita]|uniref:RNA-directed DNA polymerase n=1 Tax=Rubinisphaera margarita TaxID=2909586 RepID=UPI001EE883AC|nr:RNA-directed DNA polymerase [Rubinisphaera margarita]MCG6154739.1 RNA-directed DNA polymerase [Rubinisphaera margarita]